MELTNCELELIMTTELFHSVPQTVLLKIINAYDCTIESFKKGDIVFSPDSFSRSLGIVLDGRLRVTKDNADNRPIVMSTLSKGQLFGAAALFNEETQYVTQIKAIEPCRILFFSQRLVKRAIEREPKIAENYIRYLSERILFLNRKIYSLTAGTAEQRLAGFLLDNLTEGAYSELPMNRLADALNMSRASLYRAMDTLTLSGAIIKNGKALCINDAEALRSYIK